MSFDVLLKSVVIRPTTHDSSFPDLLLGSDFISGNHKSRDATSKNSFQLLLVLICSQQVALLVSRFRGKTIKTLSEYQLNTQE